jgi:threonine dehydratase
MIPLPPLSAIEAAAQIVYRTMPPTPQIRWPLLCVRTGADVWVKHENHTPVGAFKVRGGLVYFDELKRCQPDVAGVISATRGNHGQSVTVGARAAGLRAVVVVPYGNSTEKNAAMRSQGAELIEYGDDFQEAYEHAGRLAEEQHLHFVRSFHPTLLLGVATYSLELLRAVRDLDAVYVPIGMGSGISGCIAVRNALGLKTEVIGVAADSAPSIIQSVAARRPVPAVVAPTIADGMACRESDADAVEVIAVGASRLVSVSESEIRAAMRCFFSDTHNVAEGAAAATLAALMKERDRMRGKRVALILSGGNVDRETFGKVLLEE